MKPSIIRILLLLFLVQSAPALKSQTIPDDILRQIEQNNSTLAALRKKTDAERLGHKTDIYMPGPEADFNYLQGSPEDVGMRKDFSVRQSFDFPSAYVYRSKISDLKNDQAELEYLSQKTAVFFQVRLILADLVFLNSMSRIISEHCENIRKISELYQMKYDAGETGIVDLNKARLNLLSMQGELESNNIEIAYSLNELAGYNGGQKIGFTDTVFVWYPTNPDFESWFAETQENNPILQWFGKEIAVGEARIRLSRSMNLPRLEAGYMSEKTVGEQFRGLVMGFSIPLWENRNKTRYEKASVLASKEMETDYRFQFHNQMKALHEKIISLQTSIDTFRSGLKSADSREFLLKALTGGEISLTDYLLGYGIYYDSFRKLNEMEREKNRTIAELIRYN